MKETLSAIRKTIATKISKDTNAVIELDLSGDGEGTWQIVISDGEVTLKEGAPRSPTSVIGVKVSDLNKIVNGDIDRRTLTIQGDKIIVGKILEMF